MPYSLPLKSPTNQEELLKWSQAIHYALVDLIRGTSTEFHLLGERVKVLGSPYYATLPEALATIGSAETTLIIPYPVDITTDLVIPANVHLLVYLNGCFSIASNVTLTLNGPLTAGWYQIFSGPGAVAGLAKLPALLPEWFGALGDGSTDDHDAFRRTFDVAQACRRPVWLRPQTTYKINSNLATLSDTSLLGHQTTLDFSSITPQGTTSYVLGLRGSFTLQGLSIVGHPTEGNNLNHTGLTLYEITSSATIQDCTIKGFVQNVYLGPSVQSLSFLGCQISSGGFTAVSNSHLAHCRLSTGKLEASSGTLHLHDCTLSNYPIILTGSARVFISGCRLEKSTGYWINVNSSSSFCQLSDSNLHLEPPPGGGNYPNCLFKISNDNYQQGLVISNLWLNGQQSFYTPWLNSGHSLLVEGGGRAVVNHLHLDTTPEHWWASSSWMNLLNNSGFEAGNLQSWRAGTTGGGTVYVTNGTKKSGNYSVCLSTTQTQWVSLGQKFPVTPDKRIGCSLWRYFLRQSPGYCAVRINYYDSNNEIFFTSSYNEINTADSDWTIWTVGSHFIPSGAIFAEILLFLQSNGGPNLCYFDDIIVTIY